MINGMKAEELMIGDWVKLWSYHDNVPMPPETIQIRDIDDLYLAPRCEPIKLTSTILSQFGFIEKHQRRHLQYVVNDCHFVIETVIPHTLSVYMNDEFAGSFEVLYVHELQHLLKLLHIDKEIVL